MKKIILTSAIILLLLSSMSYAKKKDEGLKGFPIEGFPLYIYKDFASTDNNFIPSGWMGDYGDINYLDSFQKNPKDGNSCIKIEYSNKRSNNAGWAGIYWQQPANNWGHIPNAGFDLQGATKLTFWARGDKGEEVITEGKMGGISSGDHIDSDSASIGPLQLSKEWKLELNEDNWFHFNNDLEISGLDVTSVTGSSVWTDGDYVYYTPKTGYIGIDTFVYEISDGYTTDIAIVTITVTGSPP